MAGQGTIPTARADGRVALWAAPLVVPLAGLWLLIARPSLDPRWEHHPAHFWLVLAVAAVNVGVGARMSQQTRRREDTRLYLVSLAFLASAGFLALHALATPAVLIERNMGFQIATPVGLLIAAVLAAVSSLDFEGDAGRLAVRWQNHIRTGLVVVLVLWAVATVASLPPLDHPKPPTEASGPVLALAFVGTALFAFAAVRYWLVHRRRPSAVLVSVITAFVLLAEAMLAVGYSRNWHASWWGWHVLMTVAFGFVALSARLQFGREGSRVGLFNALTLEQTIDAIRADHGEALEALVAAMGRRAESGGDEPIAVLASRLASRFGLTERQVEVLERAADALAEEREQVRHLGALVAVGQAADVARDEVELLDHAAELAGAAFVRDELRIRLLQTGDDVAVDEEEEPASMRLPLVAGGAPIGAIDVRRRSGTFSDHDRFVVRSLANQLSVTLENIRLYRRIESLFRQYMSPDVAAALLADPDQASLGGQLSEVTVLMADLRGFTPFSERTPPDQIVEMLNRYWGAAVPLILAEGGTVVQFVGDALMAIFNAPQRQDDHALRAARAALAMQAATAAVAAEHPTWPRFRAGINTGPALVGNVGSAEFRNFTAIGDTTNLAARLESIAEVGQVVIGPLTRTQIGDRADVEPIGPLQLKGKESPVDAYVLRAVRA